MVNCMNNTTIGAQIEAHNNKNIPLEDDVRAYTEAMAPLLVHTLYETAQSAQNHALYQNKDFYVVLVKNVDRVLGQPKFQCWARRSCPTPVYKQDVFKWHHISGELEFLWCIPSAERYWHIVRNSNAYLGRKETNRLAQFVLLMESGSLLEWVKKENGELPDAVISIKKSDE
jgi:hypothetical protein